MQYLLSDFQALLPEAHRLAFEVRVQAHGLGTINDDILGYISDIDTINSLA